MGANSDPTQSSGAPDPHSTEAALADVTRAHTALLGQVGDAYSALTNEDLTPDTSAEAVERARQVLARIVVGRSLAEATEALDELRDALDDAIRRAFCEPPVPPLSCEDAAIVRNTARAAILSNPDRMRHLAAIQAAAWEIVKGRVE